MPDRPYEGKRQMCAVCRQRLNVQRHAVTGEFTRWAHGTGTHDHEPRPVNEVPDDVILVCDFCLTPHPVWDMPAKNMEQDMVKMDSDTFLMSVSDWAACNTCKELVVADDYERLTDRAIAGHIKKDPAQAEVLKASPALFMVAKIQMRQQMEAFREARDGDPIPITQATWLASRLREVIGDQE